MVTGGEVLREATVPALAVDEGEVERAPDAEAKGSPGERDDFLESSWSIFFRIASSLALLRFLAPESDVETVEGVKEGLGFTEFEDDEEVDTKVDGGRMDELESMDVT